MRKINTSDVFKLSRIIKKTGIKSEIAEIVKKAQDRGGDVDTDVGIDVVLTAIEASAAQGMEEDIYSLLGGIAEKEPTDIGQQSIEAMLEMLKQIANENNLKNFFSSAQKLSKNIQ